MRIQQNYHANYLQRYSVRSFGATALSHGPSTMSPTEIRAIVEQPYMVHNQTKRYAFSYLVENPKFLRSVLFVLAKPENLAMLNTPDDNGKTILDYAKGDTTIASLKAKGAKYSSELPGYKPMETLEENSFAWGVNIKKKEAAVTAVVPGNGAVGTIENTNNPTSTSSEGNQAVLSLQEKNRTLELEKVESYKDKPVTYPEKLNGYSRFEPAESDSTMEKIIGFDDIKRDLYKNVIAPVRRQNFWDRMIKQKIEMPNGILFVSEKRSTALLSALIKRLSIPALAMFSLRDFEPMLIDIYDNYKNSIAPTPIVVVAQGLDNMIASATCEQRNKFEVLLKNCTNKGVLFVATATKETNIPADFIRSGTIEKVYTLKNPTKEERTEFITNNYVNKNDIFKSLGANVKDIVNLTEGFSYADIHSILNDAARACLLENFDKGGSPQVTMEEVKKSLAQFTEQHNLTPIDDFNRTAHYDTADVHRTPITPADPSLDDLGGMYETKERLNTLYVKPMQNIDALAEVLGNDAFPDGAILYGPTGNGKSYIAKALAKSLILPLYELKISDFGTALVHESGKAFKAYVDVLKNKFKETGERSVLLLDELDSIASNRNNRSGETGYIDKELVNTLLQVLNNPQEYGLIVLGTTNDINAIDPAIARRGRLGNLIEVKAPTPDERVDIIRKQLAKTKITREFANDEEYIKQLSNDFKGNSISSITTVLKDAIREYAIHHSEDNFKEILSNSIKENNKQSIAEFCDKAHLERQEYKDTDFKTLGELAGMDDKAPTPDERGDIIRKQLAKAEITREFANDEEYIKQLSNDFKGNSISSITTVLEDAIREYAIHHSEDNFKEILSNSINENNKQLIAEFCDKAHLERHEYKDTDFKTLDELAGMDDVKSALKKHVIDVWNPITIQRYKENNLPLPGGFMLYGPPATGKTTVIETLARQMDIPLYKMDYSKMEDSQYIHKIPQHVKEIFDRLALEVEITKKPVMLFFDEAERFFPNNGDESWKLEEVNTYKSLMNDAASKGIILVGATNYINKVNPEITGNARRMGTRIYCGPADENSIAVLLKRELLNKPVARGKISEDDCIKLAKVLAKQNVAIGNLASGITKYLMNIIGNNEEFALENLKESLMKTV